MKQETKDLMKEFMESLNKRVPHETKQIKLRRHNSKKFCLRCGEIRDIEMRGMDGFCSGCFEKSIKTKLFTLDPKTKKN